MYRVPFPNSALFGDIIILRSLVMTSTLLGDIIISHSLGDEWLSEIIQLEDGTPHIET
jgi:hypothetical protein